jgi:hypothetical protein
MHLKNASVKGSGGLQSKEGQTCSDEQTQGKFLACLHQRMVSSLWLTLIIRSQQKKLRICIRVVAMLLNHSSSPNPVWLAYHCEAYYDSIHRRRSAILICRFSPKSMRRWNFSSVDAITAEVGHWAQLSALRFQSLPAIAAYFSLLIFQC